ncbi:DUF167 domain-containing protein [bacterium]|nr:DUF167 domain-containing protein [bacterium]
MIKEVENGLLVLIKIVPNSSKNDLIIEDEFIKVKVTAQPIENKANKALIAYLSKILKIPKTSIEIVKGETSKEKTILFKTSDTNKIAEIISALTKS